MENPPVCILSFSSPDTRIPLISFPLVGNAEKAKKNHKNKKNACAC
jgi:hypothetical protein